LEANAFLVNYNSIVKCGELKYLNIDCRDLDKDLSRRFFRRVFKGRLEINWCSSLKDYDLLLLNQDKGPFQRRLCKVARDQGVTTAVVQHGITAHKHAFMPLLADYLICWPEDKKIFMDWGVQEDRLIISNEEVPTKLKFIQQVRAVMFLTVPAEKGNPRHYYNGHYPFHSVSKLIKYINIVRELEPNLLIKPHKRETKFILTHLKGFKTTNQRADDLIYSATHIYCFKDCTTVKDTKVQGKTPRIIEDIYGT